MAFHLAHFDNIQIPTTANAWAWGYEHGMDCVEIRRPKQVFDTWRIADIEQASHTLRLAGAIPGIETGRLLVARLWLSTDMKLAAATTAAEISFSCSDEAERYKLYLTSITAKDHCAPRLTATAAVTMVASLPEQLLC
jgi:hypothetical protein